MSNSGTDKPRRGGRERRRFHRRNVVDRQMVTVELGGGRSGILIDLSENGMAVQPFLPIAAGTELDFHFDLPRGAGRISGKGVANSATRTGRVGVEFLHLTERSSSHLESWLKLTRDPFVTSEDAVTLRQAASQASTNPEEELDPDSALAMVVERARVVTRAEGAAIIAAGPNGFACRASAGRAPAIGASAAADATLTGECLSRGVIVTCNDTATDSRVNFMACEQLKVRSVAVVPVLIDGRISGALETLWSKTDAFTEKDIARLEQLADIASGILAEAAAAASGV